MKGSNFFWELELTFEAAFFSLHSLFFFHPLMRGGEKDEKSSDLEVPSNEGTKDASLT